MELSQEAYQAWKDDPVTREVFDQIKKERDEMIESLLSGGTLLRSDATIEVTAGVLGAIQGVNRALKIMGIEG